MGQLQKRNNRPMKPLGIFISFSVSSTNLKKRAVWYVFLPDFFFMKNSELAKFNSSFRKLIRDGVNPILLSLILLLKEMVNERDVRASP